MATPCAAPFANPVDELADGAPGYHAAVMEPTDLGAILQHLQHQQYAMPEQYRADLDRVVANSRLYNTNQVWQTPGFVVSHIARSPRFIGSPQHFSDRLRPCGKNCFRRLRTIV